jgi:hypothetical protein
MTKPKSLTRRQLAVLEELFAEKADDKAILDKYKVDLKLFNKWLTEPAFIEQLDKYMAAARRRSALHLARLALKAASRLVALSEQDKGETARKACLDIISPPERSAGGVVAPADAPPECPPLSQETASRLLEALAEVTADKQCAAKAETPDVIPAKAEIQER